MISLTMSREDWRTGSIPELPLLRKQKFKTQKGDVMLQEQNVNIKSKVVNPKIGKVAIAVEAVGLDELSEKAKELVQTLEKAKTLSNELAQINFNII